MTATTRNIPRVLAQCLRAATSQLRRVDRRVDDDAAATRAIALDSIDAVAEELEAQGTPDPAAEVR